MIRMHMGGPSQDAGDCTRRFHLQSTPSQTSFLSWTCGVMHGTLLCLTCSSRVRLSSATGCWCRNEAFSEVSATTSLRYWLGLREYDAARSTRPSSHPTPGLKAKNRWNIVNWPKNEHVQSSVKTLKHRLIKPHRSQNRTSPSLSKTRYDESRGPRTRVLHLQSTPVSLPAQSSSQTTGVVPFQHLLRQKTQWERTRAVCNARAKVS
jgi:hypothetical protein